MTPYEVQLVIRLHDAWDPKKCIGFHSVKTPPLSADCQESLVRIGAMAKLSVTFTIEAVDTGKEVIQQHYIIATRKKAP